MRAVTEHKQLPNKPYVAGGSYNEEFGGRVITRIDAKLGGTITADGTGVSGVFGDPTLRLMGEQWELVQAENPLVKADPRDLYWLSSIQEGRPQFYAEDASISAAGTALVYGKFVLDFQKLFGPACMIDANNTKVHTRGTFGATTTKYSPNAASFAGTLRQSVRTSQVDPPAAYLVPKIRSEEFLLESQTADKVLTLNFEQTTHCPGILIRAHDDSEDDGGATGGSVYRNDGLISSIVLDFETRRINGEIHRYTWQQLKEDTFAGWPSAEIPSGYVWVPLTDQSNSFGRGAFVFEPGDVVRIHFNTQNADAEEELAALANATGDKAVVTVVGAIPRVIGETDQRGPSTAESRAASFVRRGGSAKRARAYLAD